MTRGLALVFDLDGVIVDSNPVHEVAWRNYLRACGVEPPAGFERRMWGKHNDDIVRDFLGAHLSAGECHAHGAAKEAVYRELMRPVLKERLAPGVAGFLRAHQYVPVGLASNAEAENINFVLDEAGLRPYFRAVIDGQRISRPKPDPEIYRRMAEELGTAPRNCIIFEDSHTGIAAARAAGARVVALSTTHSGFAGVDLTISDFLRPELKQWLGVQKPA